MEDKNNQVFLYVNNLNNLVNSLNYLLTSNLQDDYNENKSVIVSADIYMEAIRSQTVVLQGALDGY